MRAFRTWKQAAEDFGENEARAKALVKGFMTDGSERSRESLARTIVKYAELVRDHTSAQKNFERVLWALQTETAQNAVRNRQGRAYNALHDAGHVDDVAEALELRAQAERRLRAAKLFLEHVTRAPECADRAPPPVPSRVAASPQGPGHKLQLRSARSPSLAAGAARGCTSARKGARKSPRKSPRKSASKSGSKSPKGKGKGKSKKARK
jgi:hypothetical protein